MFTHFRVVGWPLVGLITDAPGGGDRRGQRGDGAGSVADACRARSGRRGRPLARRHRHLERRRLWPSWRPPSRPSWQASRTTTTTRSWTRSSSSSSRWRRPRWREAAGAPGPGRRGCAIDRCRRACGARPRGPPAVARCRSERRLAGRAGCRGADRRGGRWQPARRSRPAGLQDRRRHRLPGDRRRRRRRRCHRGRVGRRSPARAGTISCSPATGSSRRSSATPCGGPAEARYLGRLTGGGRPFRRSSSGSTSRPASASRSTGRRRGRGRRRSRCGGEAPGIANAGAPNAGVRCPRDPEVEIIRAD